MKDERWCLITGPGRSIHLISPTPHSFLIFSFLLSLGSHETYFLWAPYQGISSLPIQSSIKLPDQLVSGLPGPSLIMSATSGTAGAPLVNSPSQNGPCATQRPSTLLNKSPSSIQSHHEALDRNGNSSPSSSNPSNQTLQNSVDGHSLPRPPVLSD